MSGPYVIKFTLDSAFQAKSENRLRQWVIEYLNTEGKNPKLAKIIEESDEVYFDLLEHDLSKFIRNIGPEENMIFHEDKSLWDKRINDFASLIRSGFQPSPIIVTDFWTDTPICKEVHISDGTHRFEALKKVGFQKYWTIFCLKKSSNFKSLTKLLPYIVQ